MTAPRLYGRLRPGQEEREAATLARLVDAATRHAGRIVQVTSLGAEGMVLTDLIARHDLPIPVATIDTGALHPQTLDLLQRAQRHYGLNIEVFRPAAGQVVHFVHQHGSDAMYRSIGLRRACCDMRKREPLSRLLAGRDAWVTGLRREQSPVRSQSKPLASDESGTACPTTRCTITSTRASVAHLARAPWRRATMNGRAVGGGRPPATRSAAFTCRTNTEGKTSRPRHEHRPCRLRRRRPGFGRPHHAARREQAGTG
jgi:Phosphoadenosine phosphosulfate reductase family